MATLWVGLDSPVDMFDNQASTRLMCASVFASGGYPARCHHGHDWRARSSVIIGYTPCDCPGVQAIGRLGHHWVRCQTEGCTSIWYDPPHRPDGDAPASLPQAGA